MKIRDLIIIALIVWNVYQQWEIKKVSETAGITLANLILHENKFHNVEIPKELLK
jgi:Zn-dependent membrane protease YugP